MIIPRRIFKVAKKKKRFRMTRKIHIFLHFKEFAMCENGRSEQPQNRTDATFSGRSMVEMLGVLAIIGVLSVGAMSGYSKAIMKYRLNKQAGQYSELINIMAMYKNKYGNGSVQNLLKYFETMNLLPEHFSENGPYHYSDILNNSVQCYKIYYENCANTSQGCNYSSCDVTLFPSYSFQSCQNLLTVARENAGQLWFFNWHNKLEGNMDQSSQIFGNAYCRSSQQNCLKNLTLSKIKELCDLCAADKYTSCSFRLTFY